jgi:hypothetical protein
MLLDKDRRGIPYHLEASSGWTKEPEWRSVLRRNKVVLMLTASSISDYSDDDKSSLQQKVADTAGVDKSLVTIDITAGSVTITATIAGPASTATLVQKLLSTTLNTTGDASTTLGITVEEVPTITLDNSTEDSYEVRPKSHRDGFCRRLGRI